MEMGLWLAEADWIDGSWGRGLDRLRLCGRGVGVCGRGVLPWEQGSDWLKSIDEAGAGPRQAQDVWVGHVVMGMGF